MAEMEEKLFAGGTVSVRLIQNGRTEDGRGKYEFRISDNGMGMSEEFLKTIYEPFTRMNTSTVSGIQGTGLGMSITKNIMDMMGGTRAIRALPDPEVAGITILAMTANAFEEDRQEALKAGMNDHLTKPIEVDRLKAALKKYLKN